MKRGSLIVGFVVVVVFVVVGIYYFSDLDLKNLEDNSKQCMFPEVLEKHALLNGEKKVFCCSEAVDMQRDNLKIKICYINKEGHNENLLYFYFDDIKRDYLLEKEVKRESGLLCTYYVNSEGSITGRVC